MTTQQLRLLDAAPSYAYSPILYTQEKEGHVSRNFKKPCLLMKETCLQSIRLMEEGTGSFWNALKLVLSTETCELSVRSCRPLTHTHTHTSGNLFLSFQLLQLKLVHSGGIIRQSFWSIFLLLLTAHFYNNMSVTFELNSLLVLI